MEYRVKQMGGKFYPQRKGWIFWKYLHDYSGLYWPHKFTKTLDDAITWTQEQEEYEKDYFTKKIHVIK